MVHCISLTLQIACRYGVSYVLHRMPAVANIMEYHKFAQHTMSSHDRINMQATLDVFAPMGEILQACLKQLCGSSAVEYTEAVGRFIAENEHEPRENFQGTRRQHYWNSGAFTYTRACVCPDVTAKARLASAASALHAFFGYTISVRLHALASLRLGRYYM